MTQALTLLRQAIDAVIDLTPKGVRELPVIEFMPTKMMWQAVSRCEAIHRLLSDGLLGEATILLRSLMWDAQRLIYMDQYPQQRSALILGLLEKHLRNWEELARLAEERGREEKPVRQKVKEQRRQLEQLRMSHGVGKLKKFPSEGYNIVRRTNRLSDMIGHKMFSISAHAAAQSMFVGESRTDDGEMRLFSRNKNPVYVNGVAGSASEYLFEGTIATAKAQEWDTWDELRERYAEIDGAFERLLKRKRQAD